MSRPLRIEYPDAWYHMMNRGGRIKENNRQELFGDLTHYHKELKGIFTKYLENA